MATESNVGVRLLMIGKTGVLTTAAHRGILKENRR